MDWLDNELAGNSVGAYLIALGIAVGVFAVLRIVKYVALKRMKRLAERTTNNIDDIVIETLQATGWYFLIPLSLYIGARTLALDESIAKAVSAAIAIAFFIQFGVWVQRAVVLSVKAYSAAHTGDASTGTMAAAIAFLARLIVWSLVFLLILSAFGVEITALIAGLGIGGIAVAFALQNVLGDLFASLALYFDRPFDIGDFIIVDEFQGNVERIGMRSCQLRSLGGEQIVFANADLAKVRIRNYKRMTERRIVFTIGIEYNLQYEKVAAVPALLREAVAEQDLARFDRAHFKGYGDSSLNYEVVYYVLSPEYVVYMDVQQAINLTIYKRFEENGIPFAFPTRTLHLHREEPLAAAVPE